MPQPPSAAFCTEDAWRSRGSGGAELSPGGLRFAATQRCPVQASTLPSAADAGNLRPLTSLPRSPWCAILIDPGQRHKGSRYEQATAETLESLQRTPPCQCQARISKRNMLGNVRPRNPRFVARSLRTGTVFYGSQDVLSARKKHKQFWVLLILSCEEGNIFYSHPVFLILKNHQQS